MSREYLMVRIDHEYGELKTYGLDERELFQYLNNHAEEKWNEDIDEHIPAVVILDKFPMPETGLGYDDDGNFCATVYWPTGGVYIVKDGKVFIPERKLHQKTVTVNEYVPPQKRTRKPAAKKAASKKASKK